MSQHHLQVWALTAQAVQASAASQAYCGCCLTSRWVPAEQQLHCTAVELLGTLPCSLIQLHEHGPRPYSGPPACLLAVCS